MTSRFFHIVSMTLTALAASVAVSCVRNVQTGAETLQLVDDLLTDSLPMLQRLASVGGQTSGCIAVIGEPQRCSEVALQLVGSDCFNNIDAKPEPDGLPDFAGETVFALMDCANSPYDSLPAVSGEDVPFRESMVRCALALLDSIAAAKMLVICTPVACDRAGKDIEELFEASGIDVPVIASSDTSFSFQEACFKELRTRNAFTHRIRRPELRTYRTAVSDSAGHPLRIVVAEGLCLPAMEQTPVDSTAAIEVIDTLAAETQIEIPNVSDQH